MMTTSKQFSMILRWIIRCRTNAFLIFSRPLVKSTQTSNGPRTVLLSIHRLPLMTFGLMKASDVRSALRLLKSVLVHATVGNLKPSNLQSLSLLFSLLTHNNARLVPWSLMMSLLVLLSLPKMIQLFLLQLRTPLLLRLVVVNDPCLMRELLSMVHAEAKG